MATATTSRLSRLSSALGLGDPPPEPALSLASVLEQESVALDQGSLPTTDPAPPGDDFTAADIADVPGFARALLDNSGTGSPLRQASALLLEDQSTLSEQLGTIVAEPSGSLDSRDAEIAALLAARLTKLLDTDLSEEPAFKELARAAQRDEKAGIPPLPTRQRNRAWLETIFGAFLLTADDRRLTAILATMNAQNHAALCLSGGGIRSASFSLGVVQGLARRGLLARFQYLSTVSGGGYTGSWLSAWMARSGAQAVHAQLAGVHDSKPEAEPAPIRHLRSYSAYLTPMLGLLSSDTWTLIATIARNVLLVWLVTLPVLAAALMIPRFIVAVLTLKLADWQHAGIDPAKFNVLLLAIGTVLTVEAIAFVYRHIYTDGTAPGSAHRDASVQRFVTRCLVPLVIGMVALAQAWQMTWELARIAPNSARVVESSMSISVLMGVLFWTFVYVAAWAIASRGRTHRTSAAALAALCGVLAGAIGGASAAALFGVTESRHSIEFYATFAVPMSLLGLLLAKQLLAGLASRAMTDAQRESNARLSAWLLIATVGWIAIMGLSLYGPLLLGGLIGDTARLGGLVGLSGATGLMASLLASSSSRAVPGAAQPGAADNSTTSKLLGLLRNLALALAMPLFAATVVIVIALVNERTLQALTPANHASPLLVLSAIAILSAVAYLLSRLIDTNRFSLHAMYRFRLVRAFLGASRPVGERQPSRFTGFDETDDVPIGALWPARGFDATEGEPRPPLHLLNLTLNLVASTDLATQSRKAIPFTVTPLHGGSATVGYRRTSANDAQPHRLYGGPTGISLGTAMAVSGAAASPNAGYHSSPAVTFLMTLFNARLGWWLGNPGAAGRTSYGDDEPRLALLPILEEMFGRTTDRSQYVYLSDGGHFENLGLYEMVRRRCRFIVVVDAGCDPACTLDDLGGAIRKIRIDFGIPIDFASGMPIYSREAAHVPADARYWATARIRYSRANPAGADGTLLYIKPAFYGHEPCDVYNYAMSTPAFPHESTANQFFGEAQFESYRALGDYVIDQLCQREFGVTPDSSDTVTAERLDAWLAPAVVAGDAPGLETSPRAGSPTP